MKARVPLLNDNDKVCGLRIQFNDGIATAYAYVYRECADQSFSRILHNSEEYLPVECIKLDVASDQVIPLLHGSQDCCIHITRHGLDGKVVEITEEV